MSTPNPATFDIVVRQNPFTGQPCIDLVLTETTGNRHPAVLLNAGDLVNITDADGNVVRVRNATGLPPATYSAVTEYGMFPPADADTPHVVG
jgi:hypothetical protein